MFLDIYILQGSAVI